MKPNATHTAHALSELLETDRATMIRCLRPVPPDAQTRGRPTWRIGTAARALGAFPCVGFITLAEFAEYLAPFSIFTVRGENGVWLS